MIDVLIVLSLILFPIALFCYIIRSVDSVQYYLRYAKSNYYKKMIDTEIPNTVKTLKTTPKKSKK